MLGIYDYEDEIREAANRYGIDPTAMLNLGQAESAGNPYAVSPAGAGGLFQHMPGTAAEMGIDRFNPGQSIDGGVGYFDKMTDKYESPLLADVAYNWGPGNLDKLMEREGTRDLGELYDDLPKETQDHLYKVWHPSSDPENDAWLKGSIPDAPDFSPSKYADVELRSARMPYSSRRSADLTRVTGEISGLEDQKREALQAMTQQGELDPDQAIAMALTAIVPALLGFGFGGGLQGAAMGAQAGAQGTAVGLQGLTSEMNRRDNSNKLLYEDAKSRLTNKEAEAKGIRDSIYDREERNLELDDNRKARREELEYLYGKDGIRKPVSTQGYSPEVTQALADAAAGKALTDAQRTAVYANPRAVDDLAEINKRADISGRAKDKLALQERLPKEVFSLVNGKEIAIEGYKELGRLVTNKDLSPERVSQVLGLAMKEIQSAPGEKFDAEGWSGIIDRLMVRSGIVPNTTDAQVLDRMKQVGRAIAIAQPGVATNEDALQEIGFVSMKPGQSVDTYLENLARLTDSKARELGITLDNASMNGWTAAKDYREKYYNSGILQRPTGGTETKMVGGVKYVRADGGWRKAQ